MELYKAWYQAIPLEVIESAKNIRLLICDIDGVFSDGNIYLGNSGEELKTFNTKDGFGIKALMNAGVEVAVITGRESQIVNQRMKSLGVKYIYQGMEDKLTGYLQLLDDLALTAKQVAYIGDDYPDAPVMQEVGLAVAVQDAHPYLRKIAHITTTLKGGRGAVRELTDLILMAQIGEEEITKGLTGVSG